MENYPLIRTVLDAFGQKLQTAMEDHDKVTEALKHLNKFRSDASV